MNEHFKAENFSGTSKFGLYGFAKDIVNTDFFFLSCLCIQFLILGPRLNLFLCKVKPFFVCELDRGITR